LKGVFGAHGARFYVNRAALRVSLQMAGEAIGHRQSAFIWP
jgi:hypothetical protein